MMQVDLWVPTAAPFVTPEILAAIGQEADERGIATLWVGEHVVLFDEYESSYPYSEDGRIPAPPGTGLLDPLGALAFLAGCTSKVRLGTAMLLLPQRNPVYTAKEVATLDYLSGGRVDLGVGVGWLAEEFAAVGAPWPRRGARTDEYIEILRRCWTEETPSFSGEFYELLPCRMEPKPVQKPGPPIHIGGEAKPALSRAARVGQGWNTFNRSPEDLARALVELDRLLDAQGRKRSELRVTVCPYLMEVGPSSVARYAEAGADALALLFMAGSRVEVAAAFDERVQPILDAAAQHS